MAVGTLRFWAAAKAAAGIAEEPYDATTLAEALAAARARHGDALARVLDRSTYVVDDAPVGGRAHESVLLTDGGSVEVLPPFAGGSAASGGGLAVAVPGLVAGLVAAALGGLALAGTSALAAGLFGVQVVIALAWLAALGTRGSLGAFGIAVAAAATIDVVLGITDNPDLGDAAPVLGLALLAALLHQLSRRPRRDVTVSLAGTVSSVAFAVCAASYLALLPEGSGDKADACALFGVGAALAIARALDLLIPSPQAFPGSRRGLVGIVVGAAAALAVGAAYGAHTAGLSGGVGLRIAVIAAALALIADVAVDAVLTQAPPPDERRLSALTPLGVLLPVVLAAPVAYVTGRILLG